MTAVRKILNNSTGNTHNTHVSMGEMKGSYGLSRDNMFYIFNTENLNKYIGLAEKPQHYSMLRIDLDFKSKNIDVDDEYDINTIATDCISKARTYLDKYMIKTKHNNTDACVLTKPSYVDEDKGIRKYGVHIVFPSIFINKDDFKLFETEMTGSIEGFDSISKNAWLIYGQHKNRFSGTYVAAYVDVKTVRVDPIEYFKKYKIYDISEKIIKYTMPLDFYYKQIFSILTLNRVESEFNKPAKACIEKVRVEKEKIEDTRNIEEIEIEVKSLVNILSIDRAESRTEWLKVGWCLHNISDGFLQIWKDFSERSDKYNEGVCDYQWTKMTVSRIGIGSLHYWAKMDNKDAYHALELRKTNPIKKKTDFYPLDNIRPDEVINQNNIGSYVPRLDKADIVCMRSNMMTYKTQNLKELMALESYKRILFVSFRVSLENEYMKVFSDYGFKLYSDILSGKISGDRIICQIDSLYKVVGEFDLLILDEFVYTLDHLNSFVKKKNYVWNAFNQYVNETNKIIVLDALLDNKTIEVFKRSTRSTWVVDNKWKSFDGKKANYFKFKDFSRLTKHVMDQLEEYGSVFFPTNSKTLADKLYVYLKSKNISVGIDSSDGDLTPSSEWKNFKVFITTPCNVAGVSCNDAFGKTICYFTASSCSAEMSSQMINRVRNTRSVDIDIFIKTGNGDRNYPLKIDEIKLWLQEKDDLIFTSGLKIDHTRNKLVEDDYYNQYIQYIKKQHTSKVCFKQVLRGILEAHGFEMRIDEFSDDFVTVEEVVDLKQLDEIKVEAKVAINEHQDKVRNEVCNAKIITEQQYSVISEQYKKTADEKLQIRRYCLTKAYGLERDLTSEFIKTFEDIIPQYYNLGKMNCGGNNLKFYIENELNNYLKENKSINNTERLHEKNHLLKLWTVHGIVQMLGFENIWDKKEICGYPYDKAIVFLEKYHHKISVLFGNNAKKDWSKLDINDKNWSKE